MKESVARILVNLDDLLDTRLGVLFHMDEKATQRLLISRYYAGRQMDNFPGFDMTQFKELYANRNKSVLAFSTMTGVINIVSDFVQRAMNKNLNSPISLEVEVHVNMHPYVLEEKEQRLISQALGTKIPLNPEISFVNYSLEQLNPYFIGTEYNTVVMYHYHDWLEIHSANKLLEKYPCPNLTLFCPALIAFKDEKLPADLTDAFAKAMMMMQPFINAIYIPVDNFCTFLANKPNKPDAQRDAELEKQMLAEEDATSTPGSTDP